MLTVTFSLYTNTLKVTPSSTTILDSTEALPIARKKNGKGIKT